MSLNWIYYLLDILGQVWVVRTPSDTSELFVGRGLRVHHDSLTPPILISNDGADGALISKTDEIMLFSFDAFREFVLAVTWCKHVLHDLVLARSCRTFAH
jgi:hypothetical protein